MRRAAIMAVALLAGAIITRCALSSTKYRRFTGADRCWTMPVYAGPAGPFVGRLTGGALVDPGTGPVRAVNLTVVVDGEERSVWRREGELRNWYVPVNVIAPQDCHWTSPDLLPDGIWRPTPLEIGLDVPLWHHLLGHWNTHHGFLPADSI